MPRRKVSFYTEQIYHIYNKSSDHCNIFEDPKVCKRFLKTLAYYRSTKVSLSYSDYLDSQKSKLLYEIGEDLKDPDYFKVDILQYCLMPNHFHLLIKQRIPTGITDYMSKCMNSFVHYYNLLNEREGPLFISQFSYPWSSLKEYINPSEKDLSNKIDVMNLFDNDIENYRQFILQCNKTETPGLR